MNYLNQESLIQSVKNNHDFKRMIEQIKCEVEQFELNDDASKISGWGHRYFCQSCGGRLIFDLNKPQEHVCETCEKITTGEMYDEVWVYNLRNQAVMTAWKSALMYRYSNDETYLNTVKDIIGFYAKHYTKFAIHDKERNVFESIESMKWGSGRIMPQGLNESIIIIRMLNALEIVKEDLDQDYIDFIYHNLFKEAYYLLKPQVNKVHNICGWKNCAIGSIGLFFNDQEMIDFAFDGPFNIRKQIREGVTEDGFWYEGSIHYNFFTLEGIMSLLLFSKLYDYDFGSEQLIVENMLKSAYHYSFNNHVFPNPNDGWPNINLKTYSYVYTVATKVFGTNSEVANLLKNIENKETERGTLPLSKPYYFENRIPLERLMLIPDLDFNQYDVVEPESRNFKSSQFGIVRKGDFNVFLKYGHRGPSHAHPDKMNIEVMVGNDLLSRDLSNSGYGASLSDEWYRMSSSHNTVVVNGKNQISMEGGQTLQFEDHLIEAKVVDVYTIQKEVDIQKMKTSMNNDEIIKYLVKNLGLTAEEAQNAFNTDQDLQSLVDEIVTKTPKIDYIRKVEITEEGLYDTFIVESNMENTYDYFFHAEAELLSELNLVESSLGYIGNGYQHIYNVRQVKTDETSLTLTWKLKNQVLESVIDLTDKEIYLAETYDNPASKRRTTLIIRHIGQNITYSVNWKVIK
jgi:oligo-alginate lyase